MEVNYEIIDLTHTISEDMRVFSGSEAPKLTTKSTYKRMVLKKHSFKCILMYKHTWIHRLIFLRNEDTLDQFSPEQFFGKALVVDCRDLKEGQAITIDKINIDKAKLAEFLLFNLG